LVDAAALPDSIFHGPGPTSSTGARVIAPGETFLFTAGSTASLLGHPALRGARPSRFRHAGSPRNAKPASSSARARHQLQESKIFVEVIKAETKGAGVDVILGHGRRQLCRQDLQALKLEGRLVNIASRKAPR